MQNLHGRKDKYKKYFDEKREMILSLPQSEGIPRTAGTNDPLPEYLDGIKAFKSVTFSSCTLMRKNLSIIANVDDQRVSISLTVCS